MTTYRVGILHPGNMGVAIAASAKNSDSIVHWASEGRSEQTHQRAAKSELVDLGTVKVLCETCSVILSVCPPHAAQDVAEQVIAHSFRGLYLDANAISPQRALRIGQLMDRAGVQFVDGGIIGGPPWKPVTTWLYLSGERAQEAADLFASGPVETRVLDATIGKASAIKMCYAGFTKGSTALLCAILATAEQLGVREALQERWAQSGPSSVGDPTGRAVGVTPKAWRFAGEMEEIAATFREAGLPGGFHEAAGDVYRRLAGFKDAPAPPSFERVLSALLGTEETE